MWWRDSGRLSRLTWFIIGLKEFGADAVTPVVVGGRQRSWWAAGRRRAQAVWWGGVRGRRRQGCRIRKEFGSAHCTHHTTGSLLRFRGILFDCMLAVGPLRFSVLSWAVRSLTSTHHGAVLCDTIYKDTFFSLLQVHYDCN